jgi:hypothetical protein
MDRIPTFAAGSLTMLVLAQRVRFRPRVILTYLLVSVGMLVLVNRLAKEQAGLRGGVLTESNPILLYADLGMANAALAVNTTTHFALGYNSLYGMISVVPRGLGLPEPNWPYSNQDYVWDKASNLLTHAYGDFGPFGFLTYLIWGAIIGWVWKRHKRNDDSIMWAVAYLWSILAVLVVWTQPLTRGPDFWAGTIVSLLAAWWIDRKLRRAVSSPPPAEVIA